MRTSLLLLTALALVAACGKEPPPEATDPPGTGAAPDATPGDISQTLDERAKAVIPKALQTCPEPRPEACTMEYAPVLGYTSTGESKKYSNSCSACADASVVGYAPEPAEQE